MSRIAMPQLTKWLVIILLAGFWHKAIAGELVVADFDESIGLTRLGREFICDHKSDEKRYSLYESVYKKNCSQTASEQKIPHIIHQIWLSDKPIPQKLKKCQQSWINFHPQWEYRLWTMDALPKELKERVERAESMQEKEDLVRLYVLEQFGGVCPDMASESVASLEKMHNNFHFYACLEPPLPKAQFGRRLHMATSFVGAKPHHPIIADWAKKVNSLESEDRLNSRLARDAKDPKARGWLTYLLFGSAVDRKLKSKEYINIILPPTYAFPIAPNALRQSVKQKKANFLAQILDKLVLRRAPPFSEVQRETIAIDTKGGTWADQKQTSIVAGK